MDKNPAFRLLFSSTLSHAPTSPQQQNPRNKTLLASSDSLTTRTQEHILPPTPNHPAPSTSALALPPLTPISLRIAKTSPRPGTMKKELQFLIWAHLLIVAVLVYSTFDLITLIYDDTFADQLTDLDLNAPPGAPQQPQLIPKIIHQTYKDTNIPEKWQGAQKKCIDLHPDYQYIMWTDEMARDFISEQYPWFLDTFDGYKYNIERADVIRYFALIHYGGIYIDLDVACERRLDPLLTVPAFVRKTLPTGISNDVMGAVPKHPFFFKVVDSLQKYDVNYFVPYLTIMYSTGPLFLSVIWKRYRRWVQVPVSGVVRIMFPEDYKKHTHSFFSVLEGSSWHLGDAQFIKSMGDHIALAVFAGFLLAAILLYGEYRLYIWLINGSYKNTILKKWWNRYVKRTHIKRNRKNSNLESYEMSPPTKIEV